MDRYRDLGEICLYGRCHSVRVVAGVFGVIFVVCGGCSLAGCAYSYVDDAGVRHVIGVVDMEIHDAPEKGAYAGQVIDMRTLGLTVNRSETGSSVSIGYNRDVSGYLKNNSLVIGNPLEFPDNAMKVNRCE
jgi:hypothetical protein